MNEANPGNIALIGSGETSSAGGKIFEQLARSLKVPLHVSVLETPAGFELNSAQVAGRVADFIQNRLQGYQAVCSLIPARKTGTPYSPDDLSLLTPLLHSQIIFFGPGSPTYAVRQLAGSRAWHIIQARHRLGAALALASAASVAVGSFALPVYEIFKVGEDPHWKPGLGLLSPYGLSLAVLPHWDNAEGGTALDTSRCFIGRARFEQLLAQLPAHATVVGMDEHTGLILSLAAQTCQVVGRGSVHILHQGGQRSFAAGQTLVLQELGPFHPLVAPQTGLPEELWQLALDAEEKAQSPFQVQITAELQALLTARHNARQQRNWAEADRLRDEILGMGWAIKDTPDGQQVSPTR